MNHMLQNVHIDSYGTFHNRAGNVRLEGWEYQKGYGLHPECLRLHDSLHIDFEGLVLSCCHDYNREYVLGDLKKQTIEEAFYSDEYNEFFNMAKGNIPSADDFICKRCMVGGG